MQMGTNQWPTRTTSREQKAGCWLAARRLHQTRAQHWRRAYEGVNSGCRRSVRVTPVSCSYHGMNLLTLNTSATMSAIGTGVFVYMMLKRIPGRSFCLLNSMVVQMGRSGLLRVFVRVFLLSTLVYGVSNL